MKFTGITFGLAIGLFCVGFFVLFFLIKFIFKRHVVDRSGLTEISEKDQPELFAMLHEIVKESQTDFPKKVYLSPEVNAAVFYDSGFWSMFLPIRKNLQIGMGLVNSLTVSEFKAVIAHEFGHFSQRSMKVGSYVYNVNYIIYNMLYDNGSFDNMLERWGSSNAYISIASSLARWVVKGIQWVLRKAYNIVNLNYLALSREMEFHADEVAAHLAGSEPLATALKRFELADYAYYFVSSRYYQNARGPRNFYSQHAFVLTFLGEKDGLTFLNGLPVVVSTQNRYNKSKLVITDQWASHPSVDDRVERLMALDQQMRNEDSRRAYELFREIENIQQRFTSELFFAPGSSLEEGLQTDQEFQETILKTYREGAFSEVFNGYYDNKNPVFPEIDGKTTVIDQTQLFNEEAVDRIYLEIALESDIQTIIAINEGRSQVKSFDYAGSKYTADEAAFLLPGLRNELDFVRESIAKNDANIYQFFTQTALYQQKERQLQTLTANMEKVEETNAGLYRIIEEMREQTHFFSTTITFDQIEFNISDLSETEAKLKQQLIELKVNPLYSEIITVEVGEILDKYIQNSTAYFADKSYNEDAIELMFQTVNQCNLLTYQTYFAHKKLLLDFMAELYNTHHPANIAS
ncbi:M48 family metallopeptidase [Dyadobacter soli]|uniref:M48 family metallopeptidase n=1 Tax=Dyadobacter soli TaxID=659014 RepID=UPI0015A06C6E|nr:M48 family metallopeptidase [Dyadobacter soli]